MNIKFSGKYKSITPFEWIDIPRFSVITGPNGTGKSQLLQLIYQTIINKQGTTEKVKIEGENIKGHEVTFLKGEWQLSNTSHVDLATIQQKRTNLYQIFQQNNTRNQNESQVRLDNKFEEVLKKTGKLNRKDVTKEEFFQYFPEVFIDQEPQLSQKIGEIFYNYRLSEIECLARRYDQEMIKSELGEKPWVVLEEIIKESKLPFVINNPEGKGIRESFQLVITNEITGEEVNFNDLSSGEKVLISLVFYLYNSQEKNVYPKLLLLDEPDAHLHPTMSQQFINVVKNVLVDKFNVRVVMTTHSPSTVILTPPESLFEMFRENPRIRKSTSKNHSASLLTSGLVYVGEGTKYFLVEDKDDVKFYSHLYSHLTSNGDIGGEIPLVFIPASTSNKSGGKSVVKDWVKKLKESGLESVIQGIIDEDYGNNISPGIFKIKRYSIENYLIDPIVTYAALLDRERQYAVSGVNLKVGEEYKLKSIPQDTLQNIANILFQKVEKNMKNYFDDFEDREKQLVEVNFVNGISLKYPYWLLYRSGKTILNEIYNKEFTSQIINFGTLFKALKKINFIPQDILNLFLKVREVEI